MWQNAPAQILVNLSVLTHITAPLRSNQKYVYSDLKLHVRKIKRNAQYSDLYTILYQRLTNAFLKGALLHLQKGVFSHLKRASFTMRKGIFCRVKVHLLFSIYESLLQPFLCPCSFHNKRVSLPLHYYNNTIKRPPLNFPVTPVTFLHITTH